MYSHDVRFRVEVGSNVLAQGRGAGLPAKCPAGVAGWASLVEVTTVITSDVPSSQGAACDVRQQECEAPRRRPDR
jgi:hypothetical protein